MCPRFLPTAACVDNPPKFRLGCSSTDVLSINLLDVNTTGILSSAVGQLTSLSLFSMQNCSLESLPASFSNLSGLQNLFLQLNRLRSLPFSLARFPQLNQVYLTDNPQLSGTIGSLATLSSLHTLQISGTQLSGQLALPLGVTNCNVARTKIDCGLSPRSCNCVQRLPNDDCESARVFTSGLASALLTVSNVGATTCSFCGDCDMQNDVWFSWKAPCTGKAVVDACGLNNSMLSIHRACPGPSSVSIAANGACNAFGGCAVPANELASFSVQEDEDFRIRVGGVTAAAVVSGEIKFSCSSSIMLSTTRPSVSTTPVPATAPTPSITTRPLSTAAPSPMPQAPPSSTTTTVDSDTTTVTLPQGSTVLPTSSVPSSTAAPATSLAAPAPSPSPLNVGLIAGVAGGVGGLFLLLLVAVLVAWLRRRKPAAAANRVQLGPVSHSNQYDVAPALYDKVPPAETIDSSNSQYSAPPLVLATQNDA